MRIIIEGPDGSGKTTLLEAFERHFQIERQPRVVSKQAEALEGITLKDWVDEDIAREAASPTFPRLYDRHRLISEPIYGPVLRAQPHPGFDDPEWFGLVYEEFWEQTPLVIWCLPPWPIVRNNQIETRDEQPKALDEGRAQTIYWLYFLESCRHPSLVWDYTSMDVNNMLNYIQGETNLR